MFDHLAIKHNGKLALKQTHEKKMFAQQRSCTQPFLENFSHRSHKHKRRICITYYKTTHAIHQMQFLICEMIQNFNSIISLLYSKITDCGYDSEILNELLILQNSLHPFAYRVLLVLWPMCTQPMSNINHSISSDCKHVKVRNLVMIF